MNRNPKDRQVLLKLDFENALNTIFRDNLLTEVDRVLPEYSAFARQLYRRPSNLIYGDELLSLARGVQQRDPLGPLFFCLVTKELSKSLQSPFNCWYLDDATLGDDMDSILEDLDTVVVQCATLGLELNLSKCEMFVFGGSRAEQQRAKLVARKSCPELKFPVSEGLMLLGAPVLAEAMPAVMQKKCAHAELLASRLGELAAHQALFLLKNCLSLPKLLYIPRCSPVCNFPDQLQRFDNIIRSSVCRITNTDMTEPVRRQAS